MATISKNIIKSISDYLSRKIILLILLFLLIGFSQLLVIYFPKDHALDAKFAYSPEDAYLSLSKLDSEKRDAYFYSILLLDMPFPILYSAFFWGISYRLWRKKWVVVPVFFTYGADFLENISISQLLIHFPDQHRELAISASVGTTIKWIFFSVIILVIAVGLVSRYFWGRKLKTRGKIVVENFNEPKK